MDYGIPQMRKRNIFLLVRKDMNFVWNFPKPNKKIINLRQALKNVPSLDPLLREGYNETVKMFRRHEQPHMDLLGHMLQYMNVPLTTIIILI